MTLDDRDKKQVAEITQNTQFKANLAFAIKMVALVATAVWTYSVVVNRLNTLEMNMIRIEQQIEMNSEFRVKWPRGELGALPDDAEQNMRLNFIEKRMEKADALIDQLRHPKTP